MISIEEIRKIHHETWGIKSGYSMDYVDGIIDVIYDSIGTCQQCKHYIEINESSGLCDNQLLPEIGVDADFFCKFFEKETE